MTHDEFEGMDIRQELRDARPRPSNEFVSRLVARVGREEDRPRRVPVGSRAVVAFAATAAALVVAGAFGGISEAAFAVENAVSSIVHVGQKAKPHHPAAAKPGKSAGASQGSSASTSTPTDAGFSVGGKNAGPPKIVPSVSPSDNQYIPECPPALPRSLRPLPLAAALATALGVPDPPRCWPEQLPDVIRTSRAPDRTRPAAHAAALRGSSTMTR